jgi:hypothetical protein
MIARIWLGDTSRYLASAEFFRTFYGIFPQSIRLRLGSFAPDLIRQLDHELDQATVTLFDLCEPLLELLDLVVVAASVIKGTPRAFIGI